MYRHVVAHGDDFTCAVKHRAGIVAPLFDVGENAVRRRAAPIASAIEW
jgi:hypothetical protein